MPLPCVISVSAGSITYHRKAWRATRAALQGNEQRLTYINEIPKCLLLHKISSYKKKQKLLLLTLFAKYTIGKNAGIFYLNLYIVLLLRNKMRKL